MVLVIDYFRRSFLMRVIVFLMCLFSFFPVSISWAAQVLSVAQPSEVICLDPQNTGDRPSEEANHLI